MNQTSSSYSTPSKNDFLSEVPASESDSEADDETSDISEEFDSRPSHKLTPVLEGLISETVEVV